MSIKSVLAHALVIVISSNLHRRDKGESSAKVSSSFHLEMILLHVPPQ